MKITDEMVEVAEKAYDGYTIGTGYRVNRYAMKAALEAAFDLAEKDAFAGGGKPIMEEIPTLIAYCESREHNLDILIPSEIIGLMSDYAKEYLPRKE